MDCGAPGYLALEAMLKSGSSTSTHLHRGTFANIIQARSSASAMQRVLGTRGTAVALGNGRGASVQISLSSSFLNAQLKIDSS